MKAKRAASKTLEASCDVISKPLAVALSSASSSAVLPPLLGATTSAGAALSPVVPVLARRSMRAAAFVAARRRLANVYAYEEADERIETILRAWRCSDDRTTVRLVFGRWRRALAVAVRQRAAEVRGGRGSGNSSHARSQFSWSSLGSSARGRPLRPLAWW